MENLFINLPRFKSESFRIVTLIPEWARAYEVDEQAIIRQLAYAHAWINANPRKAPKKSVVRFLFNWMRLAKKHGNLRVPEALRKRVQESEGDMTYEEMVAIRRKNMGQTVVNGRNMKDAIDVEQVA